MVVPKCILLVIPDALSLLYCLVQLLSLITCDPSLLYLGSFASLWTISKVSPPEFVHFYVTFIHRHLFCFLCFMAFCGIMEL